MISACFASQIRGTTPLCIQKQKFSSIFRKNILQYDRLKSDREIDKHLGLLFR